MRSTSGPWVKTFRWRSSLSPAFARGLALRVVQGRRGPGYKDDGGLAMDRQVDGERRLDGKPSRARTASHIVMPCSSNGPDGLPASLKASSTRSGTKTP